ncbi:MAG: hypothetical protein ABH865_03910 [Candidatus Omnitrophota bacterium]
MNFKKAFIAWFVALIPLFSIYAADIPDDLEEMGFTNNTLVDSRVENNITFYIFSDWRQKSRATPLPLWLRMARWCGILRVG